MKAGMLALFYQAGPEFLRIGQYRIDGSQMTLTRFNSLSDIVTCIRMSLLQQKVNVFMPQKVTFLNG